MSNLTEVQPSQPAGHAVRMSDVAYGTMRKALRPCTLNFVKETSCFDMANAQAEKPCYLLVRIRRLRGAYYLRQLRL